jgi:hypothetical protein
MESVIYLYCYDVVEEGGDYVYIVNCTSDSQLALSGLYYRVASVVDLEDHFAAAGENFRGIVRVQEGTYIWFEDIQGYVDIDTRYVA